MFSPVSNTILHKKLPCMFFFLHRVYLYRHCLPYNIVKILVDVYTCIMKLLDVVQI